MGLRIIGILNLHLTAQAMRITITNERMGRPRTKTKMLGKGQLSELPSQLTNTFVNLTDVLR